MLIWVSAVVVLLAIAVVPWLLVLRHSIGGMGAIAVVSLAVPTLVMALMFIAFATGASLGWSVLAVLLAASVAGWVWLWRSGRAWRGPGFRPFREWWPVGVGGAIALGSFLLARVLPGSPRVAWAMLGDSASQVVEARTILGNGGLGLPPFANPVPLTAALVATAAAPGRPASDAAAIFAHDLNAYALTWAALIVVSCLLAGAVGYAVVREAPRLKGFAATFAIAATSLLPLGWFWTGYPIKFGFINAHAVFVILLASVLAYFATVRRPGWGIGLQLLATVLVVLTWSPLAVFPVALALTHMVGTFSWFAALSRRARAGVVCAAIGFLGVALYVAVPLVAAARASFSVPGGLAEFPKPMLPLAAAFVATLALTSARRFTKANLGIIALCAAAVAGLAAVLALTGQFGGAWTYYPHKYAWLATAVLLTLALPLAMCLIATWNRAVLRGIGYAGVTLALAVSLGLGSSWAPGQARLLGNNLPYLMLVEDDLPDDGQPPDTVADAVVARVGLERLTIPWESDIANDYRAAFWLIQFEREAALRRDDAVAADELWKLANFHDTAEDLCRLADVVPRGVTVETANLERAGELAELCASSDLLVETNPTTG